VEHVAGHDRKGELKMLNEELHEIDVSIIIVNWNTCKITCDCLKSVYEQTKGVLFEVIVVDNASSNGSIEMFKSEFSQTNLIVNIDNRGFAAANNQGMEVAKGRYILLLNSDTIVLENAIAKIVSFADNHPEAAVAGCRVLNRDKTLQPTCFMFPSILNMLLEAVYLCNLFPSSRFFGRERMTWWDRNDTREVDVATGCFILVRRDAIKQVGMMDERFFVYGEETDWCYRFKNKGWKILFSPNAEIIHLGGQSSRQARKCMLVQLRLSILQFMAKHHGWLQLRVSCLLTALFLVVRIPVWFCIALFSKNRKGQSMVQVMAYLTGVKKALLYRPNISNKDIV